jgi:hypothetical protein
MSRVADELRREQRERFASMTPAALLALSERLGEEALAEMMATNGMDRAAALREVRRGRRLGRRPSGCADADP